MKTIPHSKRRNAFNALLGIALFCSLAIPTIPSFAEVYDLSLDYSETVNPNGPWTYGWFQNNTPDGSSLLTMELLANGWGTDDYPVKIWKNNSSLTVSGIGPLKVALLPYVGKAAVVRWTAPEDLAFSRVQITGEFHPSENPAITMGVQIRSGKTVLWSQTNGGSFDFTMEMEAGEKLDFVVFNDPNYSDCALDLSITTEETPIPFTLFDDFERFTTGYLNTPEPIWHSFLSYNQPKALYDSATENRVLRGEQSLNYGSGAAREIPFVFETDQDAVFFKFEGRILYNHWYGFGNSACSLDFYNTDHSTRFFGFGMNDNWNSGEAQVPPRAYVVIGDSTVIYGDNLAREIWYEFRAKIDWSHADSEGRYGLLSLAYRPKGLMTPWILDTTLRDLELSVEDPTEISQLVANLVSLTSYVAEMDNIQYHEPVPPEPVELVVDSALGAPVPAVGSHSFPAGSVLNASVEDFTEGSVRCTCTGWTGSGSVSASGTAASVDFTITEDSSITWHWQSNYWLATSVTGAGSILPAEGFYPAGSVQTLNAVPLEGWLFMGWSGDASGSGQFSLSMDGPK